MNLLTPWLNAGYGSEADTTAVDRTMVEQRARDPLFVAHCSLEGLRDRLPLRCPTPPDVSPSPKKRYRSHYPTLHVDAIAGDAAFGYDWLLHVIYDLQARRVIDRCAPRPIRVAWAWARSDSSQARKQWAWLMAVSVRLRTSSSNCRL